MKFELNWPSGFREDQYSTVFVNCCHYHCLHALRTVKKCITKLEDLKVLRRSPDLLNNVKIGQG